MAEEIKKTESGDAPVTYNKKAQYVAFLLLGLLTVGLVVESISKVRKQQAQEQSAEAQKQTQVLPSTLTQNQESLDSFKQAQDKARLELEQKNKKEMADKEHQETLNTLADRTSNPQAVGGGVAFGNQDPNNPNKVITVQDIYHEFNLRETERVLKARSNEIAKKVPDDAQGGFVKTALPGMPTMPNGMTPPSGVTGSPDLQGVNALIEQNKKTIADIRANSERLMNLAQQKDPNMYADMTGQKVSASSGVGAGGDNGSMSLGGQQQGGASPYFGETNKNRMFSNPQAKGPKDGESTIVTSTTLSAVLQQDVISDFPNTWIAVLQRPVYDVNQENILLPTGTRIMGRTMRGSEVNEVIQNRLGMPAFKIIRPDGKVINLENAQGLDSAGLAGVSDEVDRHWLAQMFGVAAYALVGIAPSQSNFGSTPMSASSQSIAEMQGQARTVGRNFANKYLSIVPTITIRAGTPIKIILQDDVYVTPWQRLTAGSYKYAE